MAQDPKELKERIMSRIRLRGPSLPIDISKEIGMDTLFGSAFLSELASEKKLRISNLKVGNSPLYFIKGQETLLERFSKHLKDKPREAYELLKEKRILRDSEQHPAIRIAIRDLKDFAFPFKKDGELFWRYLTVSEREIIENQDKLFPKKVETLEIKEKIPEKPKETEKIIEETPEKPKKLENLDSKKEIKKEKPKTKKIRKKKETKKQDNKFFNNVKEFLIKKDIEILDIEGFNKTDLILRVKDNNEEKLLIAYNKKRIREEDIINANKKASELNLKYIILSLGEPLKKLSHLIKAIQNLNKIDKIE